MKELIVNVPEDAVNFVEEFVERIGGTVANNKSKKIIAKAGKTGKLQPLDFFGTWPDISLDPVTYRKKLWRKTPEF